MKRWMFLILLMLASRAEAQVCAGFAGVAVKPYAYEAITVSTTAIGFTASLLDTGAFQAVMAVAMLETDSVRVRSDGGVPTSTVGQLVASGANVGVLVCGQSAIKAFRAIRVTTDASLKVQYYAVGN